MDEFITLVIEAIRQITTPRYFNTERGYVGEFYLHLGNLLRNNAMFPEHAILETEVQKRVSDHYGVRQRPDLLVHIPIETGLTINANENNFVVFAFKQKANRRRALNDFDNLNEMFLALNYEKGIFINIKGYPRIFLDYYTGNYRERIHELSIGRGEDFLVNIKYSYFENGEIRTIDV
jgi:hypothetical protein